MTLVRHAETTANASRTIAGWTDVDLTDRGRAHAARLMEVLDGRSFDGVWSSDLRRAVETARLAGFDPRLDARVRELDFGRLEGEPWASLVGEYGQKFAEFGVFEAPGGESFVDLRRRVLEFLDHLAAGSHLVFCHGGVIRLVLAELGDHRFVDNCTVLDVNWTARSVLAEAQAPR